VGLREGIVAFDLSPYLAWASPGIVQVTVATGGGGAFGHLHEPTGQSVCGQYGLTPIGMAGTGGGLATTPGAKRQCHLESIVKVRLANQLGLAERDCARRAPKTDYTSPRRSARVLVEQLDE